MIQDLENLIKLQEIDLRIHEQEMAQEKYPSQVIELQKEIDQVGTKLANLNKKLEIVKSDSQNVTDQISKGHELQEKSQDRLSSIKTNREYDAVHAEIEAQKNIMNSAEISKKNLEQEIEKLTAAISELSAEYEKVKAANEPQIKELNEKISAIDSNIAEITKERDVIVPKVGKAVMRTYELIRKKRKTRRVISLISKSKNCTYCYKILEPQLYNEIKRGTKLILCQNCGSIMIWDEESAAKSQQS
ncbi:MAG: hypothetical protein Q4F84_10385 [Fibrobacter sp.]|nr:hypothetical protein [Fibrobacter sp.]